MSRLIGWSLLIGVLVLLFFLFDPTASGFPQCPVVKYTGLYCPGCGSQRAVHALVHGHFFAVFGYNPLVCLAIFYFIAEIVIWGLNRTGRQIRSLSERRWTPLIILAVVITFWVLRNIPMHPFEMLAPSA
jgi:hypothetical protein